MVGRVRRDGRGAGPEEAGAGVARGRRGVRGHLDAIAAALGVVARRPNLRNAQLSWGAAWTGEWAFVTALAVFAFEQGGAAAVALIGVLRLLPAAALVPLATVLADRMRRERILIASAAVRTATTVAVAAAAAAQAPAPAVYALAVLATIAFAPYFPAHGALLPSLCRTPGELTSANAARGLLDALSALAGPLLAAALLAATSPAAVFTAGAAMAALSGIAIAAVRYEAPPSAPAGRPRSVGRGVVDGLREVLRNREAGVLIGLGAAQTAVRGALNVLLVVMALDLLDLGEPGVGLLAAAIGAGGLVGALGASLLAGGRRLAVWYGVGIALWSLPLAVVGAWPAIATAVAMLAVIGVANALVDVTVFTLLPRTVSDAVLARVFGALQTVITAMSAVGAAVAPALVALLGARGALVAVGLCLPPLVALAWPRLRAMDRRIDVRDREIALLHEVPMLRSLPVPTVEHLASGLEHLTVGPGQPVFEQGEPGNRFYIIADGQAEVVGDGQPIRMLDRGSGFGEIALLHDVPRTATVTARTELELYALTRDVFVPAVTGYAGSAKAADATVAAWLATFRPRATTV